jgi:hypothetical protein
MKVKDKSSKVYFTEQWSIGRVVPRTLAMIYSWLCIHSAIMSVNVTCTCPRLKDYWCGLCLMFNLGHTCTMLQLLMNEHKGYKETEYTVTQQFCSWKGKDRPTCQWLIIHMCCFLHCCQCCIENKVLWLCFDTWWTVTKLVQLRGCLQSFLGREIKIEVQAGLSVSISTSEWLLQ